MKENVLSYVRFKNFSFKERVGHIQMACPFEDCEDHNQNGHHFYIYFNNEVFKCMKCGKTGHILRLKRELGDLEFVKKNAKGTGKVFDISIADRNHAALLSNTEALDYLKSRGYTDEFIRENKKLGYAEVFRKGRNIPCIVFHTFYKGKLTGIKYKSIKKYQDERGKAQYHIEAEPGCTPHLYNGDKLDPSLSYAVITEGEYDCDTGELYGIKNITSCPSGATGFGSWVEELDPYQKIYIVYDNDGSGDKGAEELAQKLGRYRCFRVSLPLKDLNECKLAGVSGSEITACLKNAERYIDETLVPAQKVIQKLDDLYENVTARRGYDTGIQKINKVLVGYRDAEVTVVTGDTAAGKTTLCVNLLYHCLQQDLGILICSSEVLVQQVMAKLISIHTKTDFYDKEKMTPEKYAEARDWLLSKTIFFIDAHGEIKLEQIEDAVEWTSRFHHVKVVLLDHLHFFIDDEKDEYPEIKKFSKGIEKLVKRTKVHAFLVVHPKQLDDPNILRERGMAFLRGGAAIKQNADNVIVLWRDEESELDGENHVELIFKKIRDDAAKLNAQNSTVDLYFDASCQRYYEEPLKPKQKKKEKQKERTGRTVPIKRIVKATNEKKKDDEQGRDSEAR